MMLRKRLWSILALCFAVSLWKIFRSWSLEHSSSAYYLGEWLQSELKSCSFKRCTNLSNLDWFCGHFDASVDALLTPENLEISPDVLVWWMKLQQSHNESEFQAITKHLFDVLPPPAKGQDIAHCGTCAVVGNSGRLKDSKYGEKIDSHHYVLRMNKAQTAGFEDDVGTKTTHHFMYPESAMDLHPGVHLVLVPFKPLDLKWLASAFSSGDIQHTYRRVKQFIEADKDKVLILNPAFLKYIQDKWVTNHGRYPSTGIIALMFAIHSCRQVSVFGFGADNNGNWHHYWEKNRFAGAFRKTGVHDAITELTLIEKLATEGKVVFYE